MTGIRERLQVERDLLRSVAEGHTPWLDRADSKRLVRILDETISILTANDDATVERCCRALCERYGEDPGEIGPHKQPLWMDHEATVIFILKAAGRAQ